MGLLNEKKSLRSISVFSLVVISISILFSAQPANASLIGDNVTISLDGAENISGQPNPQNQIVTQGIGPEFGWGAGSGCGIPDESISIDVEDSIINVTLSDGTSSFLFCDDNGFDLGNPFSFNITSLDWVDEGGIVTGINFLNSSNTSFDATAQVLGTHSVQINITAFGGAPLTTEFFDFELQTLHGGAKIPTFGTPLQLSVNGESQNPDVVANFDRVFVMWRELDDLFVAWSDDKGSTFQTPFSVNSGLAAPLDPQIHLSGQDIRVVWRQGSSLLYSQSLDNGDNFSMPIDLSSGTETSQDPQIATFGNKVYVTWDEQGQTDNGIHFARSINNGINFTSVNLSGGAVDTVDPQIAANGDNAYLVWKELGSLQDVFFIKSDNSGATFSSKENLTNTFGVEMPLIGTSGNNVYVAWADTSSKGINFLKSPDNGENFGSIKKLSNNDLNSFKLTMEVSGNDVHISWREPSGISSRAAFISSSNNNGTTFSDPVNLSNSENALIPRLSSSLNIVDVVWVDENSGNGFDFSRSDDNGVIFSIKQNIFNSSNTISQEEIFTQGKNSYIVWIGVTEGFTFEAFFLAGIIPVCNPPVTDDWIITESCEISSDLIAPASVMIQNNSVVTINPTASLTIQAGENMIIVDESGLELIHGSALIVLS